MKPSVARSPLDAVAPAMAQAGTDSPMTTHLQELVRRACAGEHAAWEPLRTELSPLMQRWANCQQQIDPAVILDRGWAAFVQTAPLQFRNVRAPSLLMALTSLRTCVKTALLIQLRTREACTCVG